MLQCARHTALSRDKSMFWRDDTSIPHFIPPCMRRRRDDGEERPAQFACGAVSQLPEKTFCGCRGLWRRCHTRMTATRKEEVYKKGGDNTPNAM